MPDSPQDSPPTKASPEPAITKKRRPGDKKRPRNNTPDLSGKEEQRPDTGEGMGGGGGEGLEQAKNPNKRVPGRPRKISSPEEFDHLVNEYVINCLIYDEPILRSGLLCHLNLFGAAALEDYEARPEFSKSVKRARGLVERWYERRMATADKGGAAAGAIFALKNMGWSDRVEIDTRVAVFLAKVDLGKLPDHVVSRLADGESPMAVLSEIVDQPEAQRLLKAAKAKAD